MEDELDELFPPGEVARVIAHPQRKNVADEEDGVGSVDMEGGIVQNVKRMTDIKFPGDGPKRILVAVG